MKRGKSIPLRSLQRPQLNRSGGISLTISQYPTHRVRASFITTRALLPLIAIVDTIGDGSAEKGGRHLSLVIVLQIATTYRFRYVSSFPFLLISDNPQHSGLRVDA